MVNILIPMKRFFVALTSERDSGYMSVKSTSLHSQFKMGDYGRKRVSKKLTQIMVFHILKKAAPNKCCLNEITKVGNIKCYHTTMANY